MVEQLEFDFDLEEKYGEVLEKINNMKDEEKEGSRTVELFFSFDIVNSSSYKDMNYFGWQIVLTSLLTKVQKNIAKTIPGAQLWRVLGDEIIFFITIKDIEEIYSNIDAIYVVLADFNRILHNGSFYEKLKEEYQEAQIDVIQNKGILALQAAAWIAIINNDKNSSFELYDNVFKKYSINENQQINEFLGQDIDTGFRIKKQTQDRRLVVSVELAKILSDRTEYLARLNIITYKKLKGVWKDRLYPIICYHDEKISGIPFKESFYYDETTYSQLSKEYFSNRKEGHDSLPLYMFLDVHKALNKIIKDQQLDRKMERILEIINDTEIDVKAVESEFNIENKLLEFHCAAVCCDTKNKKILIAKRKNRKFLTGLWEFGCAKANIEKNLCDSIIEEYKSDFGIDIDVICDQDRGDREPKPIALYQIQKADKIQKGVIVVAEIIGGVNKIKSTIQKNKKHEKYRWISENEIDDFEEEAINDFKDTLRKIFSKWDEYFGK